MTNTGFKLKFIVHRGVFRDDGAHVRVHNTIEHMCVLHLNAMLDLVMQRDRH
jgi:hypothetical protein